MKILHILKSEPDGIVEKFCDGLSKSNESSVISLYEGEVDWPGLVEELFLHDQVICWW